jgi:hypothetical protein
LLTLFVLIIGLLTVAGLHWQSTRYHRQSFTEAAQSSGFRPGSRFPLGLTLNKDTADYSLQVYATTSSFVANIRILGQSESSFILFHKDYQVNPTHMSVYRSPEVTTIHPILRQASYVARAPSQTGVAQLSQDALAKAVTNYSEVVTIEKAGQKVRVMASCRQTSSENVLQFLSLVDDVSRALSLR